jgi:hypothetical protein
MSRLIQNLCIPRVTRRKSLVCNFSLKTDYNLKGLSHEIFGPVFWAVWMYVNRLWFLNFNDASLLLDNYF